ncbi:MAG TPA: 50S ribosomal protein L29 [Proteobacteria bacterium]|jgi:large subunit ribosomal protein L29|nr:MAG: 50S ribosomal protein L29 [Deltaproteobacteria bacterium]HDJ27687.1 50S ribosomal protein L29 [Pseudomonadota bacterium]
MKAKDVRLLSPEEMQQKVVAISEELFNLRFQKASGQLQDTARLRNLKRDRARIKTILREHDMQG